MHHDAHFDIRGAVQHPAIAQARYDPSAVIPATVVSSPHVRRTPFSADYANLEDDRSSTPTSRADLARYGRSPDQLSSFRPPHLCWPIPTPRPRSGQGKCAACRSAGSRILSWNSLELRFVAYDPEGLCQR